MRTRYNKVGKRKRNKFPKRPCKYCGTKIDLNKLLPKERERRKFCSISCSRKYYVENPTQTIKEGEKIRVIKSAETRKGKPLSPEHKKKHAEAMARRRGQKLSEETKKKLSKVQKERWRKIPTVERTNRFWRISKHARKLHQTLNWPEEYLEYPVQIQRVKGQFKKGEIYFLYIDIAYPKLKIAIEIDGPTHLCERQKRIDTWKEKQLENLGWKVLRFWNQEVDNKPRVVKAKIRRCMTSRLKEQETSLQKVV